MYYQSLTQPYELLPGSVLCGIRHRKPDVWCKEPHHFTLVGWNTTIGVGRSLLTSVEENQDVLFFLPEMLISLYPQIQNLRIMQRRGIHYAPRNTQHTPLKPLFCAPKLTLGSFGASSRRIRCRSLSMHLFRCTRDAILTYLVFLIFDGFVLSRIGVRPPKCGEIV